MLLKRVTIFETFCSTNRSELICHHHGSWRWQGARSWRWQGAGWEAVAAEWLYGVAAWRGGVRSAHDVRQLFHSRHARRLVWLDLLEHLSTAGALDGSDDWSAAAM